MFFCFLKVSFGGERDKIDSSVIIIIIIIIIIMSGTELCVCMCAHASTQAHKQKGNTRPNKKRGKNRQYIDR